MLAHRIRYHCNYAMGEYKVQGRCEGVHVALLSSRFSVGCSPLPQRWSDSCVPSRVLPYAICATVTFVSRYSGKKESENCSKEKKLMAVTSQQ